MSSTLVTRSTRTPSLIPIDIYVIGKTALSGRLLVSVRVHSRITAGVLLLTILFIEYGGWFLLRVVRGLQHATHF